MDRDRATIDKLAQDCGLAPYTYSPEGGEERSEIWEAQKAAWSNFADYEKATTRTIPVVLLTRR